MAYNGYYTPRRDSGERPSRNLDPTLQLERDRIRNDMKLKSRFEHIFEKYAKDFSNVGDEIDMETGEVVVDNGHLTYMQHERDPGSSDSSHFLRLFAEELEEEGADDEENGARDGSPETGDRDEADEGSEDDLALGMEGVGKDGQATNRQATGELDNDDSDDEDELSIDNSASQRASLARFSRQETPAEEHSEGDLDPRGDDLDDDSADEYAPTPPPESRDSAARRSQSLASSDQQDDDGPALPSTEMTLGFPSISIEQSLNALVPHQDSSGRIDPGAIQDLGMSIANQIADFLMRATAGRLNPQPHVSRDPWSVPPLPRDSFHPHMSIDHGRETPRADRLPSVMDSPGASSLWAPAPSYRRARPAKRRKKDHAIAPQISQPSHESLHHTFDPEESSPSASESGDSPETLQFPGRSGRHPHEFSTSRLPHYPPVKSRAGTKFRQEEDNLLKRLRDHDRLSWAQMTTYFPGRSPVALQTRYQRALKDLPCPVVVKREIIEIMDGEDEVQSEGTPNWRLVPPSEQSPQTPLLRQALHSHFTNRDDTPITVTDDDGDDTESTPPYSMHASGPPPNHAYAPAYYFPPPPGQQVYTYPYTEFPPPNGVWYTQPPPPPGLKSKKAKPRTRPDRQGLQPRYTCFDTTQGDGRFGILRTTKPTEMPSTPQQHLIGPFTGRTGAFGVLKMAPEKTAKGRKLAKALKVPSSSKRRSKKAGAGNDATATQAHARNVVPGMLQIMPAQQSVSPHAFMRTAQWTAVNRNDRGHFEWIREESELPNRSIETPYFEGGPSGTDSGPHHLSSTTRTSGVKTNDNMFVNSTMESLSKRLRKQKAAPLLPTPPSDGSVRHSETISPPTKPNGVAPTAQMVPPPPAVASPGPPRFTTIQDSYASPTPTAQSRAPSIGVVRKRAASIEELDSADELA